MLSYRPNVDKCFFWKYKRKVSHFARISSFSCSLSRWSKSSGKRNCLNDFLKSAWISTLKTMPAKKQRDKNMKVSESLLFTMAFKNQWHYLDFQSHCISFSSLLVLTTSYWVVMRPKRTNRTESEATMKKETGNHWHLDNLSSCGISKKDK